MEESQGSTLTLLGIIIIQDYVVTKQHNDLRLLYPKMSHEHTQKHTVKRPIANPPKRSGRPFDLVRGYQLIRNVFYQYCIRLIIPAKIKSTSGHITAINVRGKQRFETLLGTETFR